MKSSADSFDTLKKFFFEIGLSITNVIDSTKMYDRRDDFDFQIENNPFLDEDIPRSPSYGLYISQINIRFAKVCPNADDFNNITLFCLSRLSIS